MYSLLCLLLYAQPSFIVTHTSFVYRAENPDSTEIKIIPHPLQSNSYFHIKVPDGEALKWVEVIDSTGKRVNKTDITFTKMGLYLPKIFPGEYGMRIKLSETEVIKKIVIQ